MRGRGHAIFYMCEEIITYILVIISSMGKDPKPPSKYHLALHTRSTQFQVSLGTWGHARVEQQELKKFMLGQIEAQRVPGFQQD